MSEKNGYGLSGIRDRERNRYTADRRSQRGHRCEWQPMPRLRSPTRRRAGRGHAVESPTASCVSRALPRRADLPGLACDRAFGRTVCVEADSVCGAAYGARDAGRTNRRNGYRHRDLDTRIGTLDVAVPKLREGSYCPEWLLERCRRAQAALTSVVATCYLLGSPRGAWIDSCSRWASPAVEVPGVGDGR
jgi:hypothetical protein